MGFWREVADKVGQKKKELEEEAKKRVTKKATEMALGAGKAAAKAAVRSAGRTLDYAGKHLEEALFPTAGSEVPGARSGPQVPDGTPDPFAKVKADEAARQRAAQQERASVRDRDAQETARERTDVSVDDELAALKRKIRGP